MTVVWLRHRMSNAWWATIVFSRLFSSSGWSNRRASFISRSPYFTFQW